MRQPRLVPTNLVTSALLLAAIIAIGIVGFLLQGFGVVDAVFTTVSAITTAGYTPNHALTSGQKIFTTGVILAGVGAGVYVLGSFTEFLVEGGLAGNWEKRSMSKRLHELSEHYIICGFGRVGQQVATDLEHTGVPFVVVDSNPDTIAVARSRRLVYFEGDATSDPELEEVGVRTARALLACADSDVNNVYVTLSARALNPGLYIVARASRLDVEHKLRAAGASRVVSPYTMAGTRMAHLAVQPLAADYVGVMMQGRNLGVLIEERVVPEESPLANRSVGDIRHRELSGGHVLAAEQGGKLITFVDDDLIVRPGDRILVAGTPDQLTAFDLAIE